MKVTVRVKTPAFEYSRKRKIENDGKTVIMRKSSKTKGGWRFTIPKGSLNVRPSFWGTKYFVDILAEAPEAIKYDTELDSAKMPKWDKDQSKRFIEAEILKKAATEPKEKSSMILWIIALIGIGNIVLTLITSGRIRIG
jgi:hypothetical protein